jgi:hypothetical protein
MSSDPRDRERELEQLSPAPQSQSERLARKVADPVLDSRRVVLARVVAEAFLSKDIERPRGTAGDREGRGPVPEWSRSAGTLDLVQACLDVAAKLGRLLLEDASVCEAVAGDLVSPPGELSDRVRVEPGAHAEDEERRSYAELVEKVEDHFHLPPEGKVRSIPVLAAEAAVDDLVPVLEVEREREDSPLGRRVDHFFPARVASMFATNRPIVSSREAGSPRRAFEARNGAEIIIEA